MTAKISSRGCYRKTGRLSGWLSSIIGVRKMGAGHAGNATSYVAAYTAITNQVSGGPSYDANGNQLSSTGLRSINWNASGNAATVTPQSGAAISGTYDALNRLVETPSSNGYSEFVYGPAGDKAATVASGTLQTASVSIPGGETAVYNTSGLSFIRHTDWLGSARLDTTWAHAVYSKESYAPFGETFNEVGTADRFFTGHDQSEITGAQASGTYETWFRKYDPAAGRWLSPDPLGWESVSPTDPQSLDRYAYVTNRPLSYVDPLGLNCMWDEGVSDDDPSDGGASYDECVAQGGTWMDTQTVTATGGQDGCSSTNLSACPQTDPPSIGNGYFGYSPVIMMTVGSSNVTGPCKCFSPSAFANTLDANAHQASQSLCGRYVGWALSAGGANVGSHNGADYGSYLPNAGFSIVSPSGYMAQMGDVAVFKANAAHQYGHIAGFDGKGWVSDFFQPHGANPYKHPETAGPMTIYRSNCKC